MQIAKADALESARDRRITTAEMIYNWRAIITPRVGRSIPFDMYEYSVSNKNTSTAQADDAGNIFERNQREEAQGA